MGETYNAYIPTSVNSEVHRASHTDGSQEARVMMCHVPAAAMNSSAKPRPRAGEAGRGNQYVFLQHWLLCSHLCNNVSFIPHYRKHGIREKRSRLDIETGPSDQNSCFFFFLKLTLLVH